MGRYLLNVQYAIDEFDSLTTTYVGTVRIVIINLLFFCPL